jgi:ATP-binding cassette subfamily C (CFTR/MRP) protein 1
MKSLFHSLCWGATPFFVSFLSFGLYSMISNEPLTSTKVFVSLALFNLLQFPLNVFPSVISSIIDASVSFSRLYNFLRSEELDSRAVKRESMLSGNVGAAALLVSSSTNPIERIAFKNGTFHWDKTSTEPILSGVSVSVSDRQLVAVVGVVGSGKSSLLSAILGEVELMHFLQIYKSY